MGGDQSEIVGESASCSVVVKTNKSGVVWDIRPLLSIQNDVSEELKEYLIIVRRKSDRVMSIELGL